MHALVDAIGDIEPEFVHRVDGELPCVVLFEAAWFVGVESDGVVSDLVEEDGSGHWAFGLWGFEKLRDGAIAVGDLPGDA